MQGHCAMTMLTVNLDVNTMVELSI